MFNTLWAAAPGRRCIAAIRGKQTIHFWFDTNDEALEKALELDKEGYNVYFSPSLFDSDLVERKRSEVNPRTGRKYTGREQSTVSHIPALWIDLDAGEGKDYSSVEEAFVAFNKWVLENKIPAPTHVVCSGYGLHIYWRLTRVVSHREWLPVAKHLKQACRVGGLSIDPARTADSASLMRVPGTTNHKRGATAPVVVLGENEASVDLNGFRAALPMVGPVGTVGSAASVADEWNTQATLPPGDANKIADKCQQMGQVRFHQGKVEEPLWRAALSILWRCQDKETFIHEWSVGDDRYDPEEAIEKARATGGPATCQHFADINAEGCVGCPHAGVVRSPINLAFAEEVPEEVAEEDFTRVPGYTVNSSGVYMQPMGEGEGPLTKIADFPVWIEEAREVIQPHDPSLQSSLLLAWVDIRGRYRQVPITQAKLHDDRQWTAWLADNNLISFMKAPQMRNYISQMHKARFKDKGARTVFGCLGWYDDHKLFVLGKQGITAEGTVDVAVNIKAAIADLEPEGDLAGWKHAIANLERPEFQPQAFGLLLGFAAPLLDLVGKNGGVVVFAGRSGFGKSLAAKTGLSIFSHPEQIFETAESSHKSIALHMSEHRHVPVLVDEVTTLSANRLRELIYMAANGSARTTLTQNRERRAMGTWQTVTMLTSNHSIVEQRLEDIEEAHRRRIIEVPVLTRISREDAETIYGGITENYGVAAPPFLQFVMQHMSSIPALFAVMEQQVREWGYTDPADRFAVWTCAAALLGGILAYVAGVLPFNPIPVVRSVVGVGAKEAASIMLPGDHAREVLFELLTSESKRVCFWTTGKFSTKEVDDPVARIDGNVLSVRSSDLRLAWHQEHIFLPSIKEWLDDVTLGGTKRRSHRLAPGTPPVSCYQFDMEKLGWNSEDFSSED